MPETPIWLLSRGRYEDAEKALCWLRGWVTPDVVREEFNQLVKYSNEVNKTNFPVTTVDSKTVSVRARKNCMYNLR
jgi:SP family facilitated glucose transporter-like MFS transporter 8